MNHELNIASEDPGLARQVERIHVEGLKYAHEVTHEQWRAGGPTACCA